MEQTNKPYPTLPRNHKAKINAVFDRATSAKKYTPEERGVDADVNSVREVFWWEAKEAKLAQSGPEEYRFNVDHRNWYTISTTPSAMVVDGAKPNSIPQGETVWNNHIEVLGRATPGRIEAFCSSVRASLSHPAQVAKARELWMVQYSMVRNVTHVKPQFIPLDAFCPTRFYRNVLAVPGLEVYVELANNASWNCSAVLWGVVRRQREDIACAIGTITSGVINLEAIEDLTKV